jgi:HEAT repeat protein
MKTYYWTIICFFLLAVPLGVSAQDCTSLRKVPIEQVLASLHRAAEGNTPDCVDEAFRIIGKAQRDQAIPALIGLLTYKRPENQTQDPSGAIFAVRPRDTFYLYPATAAFEHVGKAAEGPLLEFIGNSPDEKARENATYALLAISHNYPYVIGLLHKRSALMQDVPREQDAADRLAFQAKRVANSCISQKKACLDQLDRH